MGILAWNAEGEVCPLGDSKVFSAVSAPLRSVLNVCHWHTAPPLHTSPPKYCQ